MPATIEIVPAEQWLNSGDTTTVEVRISDATDLFAAEILLEFNPALLEVVDADTSEGAPGIQIAPGTFPDPNDGFMAANQVDNTTGTILYAVTLLSPSLPVSGSGPLAYITFRGKAAGDSVLAFQRVLLSNQEAMEIPVAANDGVVHIEPSGPTPTPTKEPTPGACQQIVFNPSFEQDRYWVFGNTPRPARYTTVNRYSGERSVLMGITPPGPDELSFSSVWQAIRVPQDAESATLSFWYWPATEEVTNRDWQTALIYDAGLNHPPLAQVLKIRSNARTWQHHQQDLTQFRGQTITLYFTAVNNGQGNRLTWWYLDDVTVEVCGSNSVLSAPPQPQESPNEELLLDLLNSSP